MNGLKTARALVLDDNPEESVFALEALSKLGIGTYYYKGDTFPENPITGIRVLVLDMVLANLGATGDDPKQDMGILMGALEGLINPGDDSLIVICWTKHVTIVQLLQEALKATFPKCRISKIIVVPNKRQLVESSQLDELSEEIKSALINKGADSILHSWEQLIHDACSEITHSFNQTSNELSDVGEMDRITASLKIASALAVAERGIRLKKEKPDDTVKAFTNALIPLLADRVEYSEELNEQVDPKIKEALFEHSTMEIDARGCDSNDSLLSEEIRSKLNTAINVSFRVNTGVVYPGSAFSPETPESKNKTLIANVFQPKLWSEIYKDSFFTEEHKTKSLSVIIEITAPCDFAQSKNSYSIFCAAFLTPTKECDAIRSKSGHLKVVGPFNFNIHQSPQSYYLVLNCHYISGMKTSQCNKLTPLFRLRSALLADIAAWQANHLSRPGYIELGPSYRTATTLSENDIYTEKSDT